MTQDMHWLALTLLASALFYLPYVLNRMVVRGLMGTLANPAATDKPLAPWAERARRAHANNVENLVVFAPAALAVQLLAITTPMTATACAVFFFARVVHYIAYSAGIPGVRTLAFFAGWFATLALIGHLLGWL